ncbi:MAG: hypothetical protein GTO53_10140 [Planctomycetales bacterium]|nr:hypothetical protein [Planctomycetales bacterium]NIM09480.1 hypothetical protein [Planctomycetales bacterium]NIN08968.1 hypothetical protein [Planctomycetales bacterium]NIN78083.1 hypothetical protein [Planctomycetales bacterium]NIO35261.1 hypothetical protein [Planctomycetales bacterium]
MTRSDVRKIFGAPHIELYSSKHLLCHGWYYFTVATPRDKETVLKVLYNAAGKVKTVEVDHHFEGAQEGNNRDLHASSCFSDFFLNSFGRATGSCVLAYEGFRCRCAQLPKSVMKTVTASLAQGAVKTMFNAKLRLGLVAGVMVCLTASGWSVCKSEAVPSENTAEKETAKKPAAKPKKEEAFRVFTDFPVDPLMSGWQSGAGQATSIQSPEDLKKFSALVQKNPLYTNPRFWKGDTPDKTLSKALKKHKVDLTKQALVVLRYSTGPNDKVVATSDLKNRVLTVKVSKVHVGKGGPQPPIAMMKPIAVVVDRSKVDKVVFEYWGKKSETKIQKTAAKVAPKVNPVRPKASEGTSRCEALTASASAGTAACWSPVAQEAASAAASASTAWRSSWGKSGKAVSTRLQLGIASPPNGSS